MREILFRGIRKLTKEWIYGSLHIEKFTDDEEYLCCEICQCDIFPETVGQYTGLTDKNGTKIFEGDIVKGSWNTVFQVVYDDWYLGFRAKEKSGYCNCLDYYGLNKLEVIGNVHDNPELLKENEQ